MLRRSDYNKMVSFLLLRDGLPEEANELKKKFTQICSAMFRREEYHKLGYLNPMYKLNKFDEYDDYDLGEIFDNTFKIISTKYEYKSIDTV